MTVRIYGKRTSRNRAHPLTDEELDCWYARLNYAYRQRGLPEPIAGVPRWPEPKAPGLARAVRAFGPRYNIAG